ncbi:PRKC apoptosis WT1 regulator protein [Yaravirus sp. 'brasiliensis']|uniref:PRKC apoptosis WT1 regulator protein n=1 Tax=Yaravirus sp. 'brasiliensis' TaxID=2739681 RepID=A0AAE7E1N1_9VIRU|nr:PRKC apoptosis WT1 regulator protein [Yaravirus brasiliensis]QKE44390.1 PRKC apoptosis WT1 regulator protein [Yaravirus brasiliensis]
MNSNDVERENWTLKRELAKVKAEAMDKMKSNERLRSRINRLNSDVLDLETEKEALQKELFEAHRENAKLREQVAVLKRANEINEKQIRDYERAQVDVRRPPRPREDEPFPAVYGIAMR